MNWAVKSFVKKKRVWIYRKCMSGLFCYPPPPKKKLSTILSTKKMSYEQNTNCNSSICHVFCNYSDSWSIWIQNKVNCFYSKHRFNVIKINGQNENRQRTVRKKSSVERNCLWRSIYYRSTRLYVLTFLITSSTIKIKR